MLLPCTLLLATALVAPIDIPSFDLEAKPVLATLLLNPVHENRLRSAEAMDPAAISVLLDLAREEALEVQALQRWSDENLRNLPGEQERRRWVRESGYNQEAAALTRRSREALAELLDPREAGFFLAWLEQSWERDRARAYAPRDEGTLRYTVFMTQYYGYTDYEIALPDKYLKFANLGWEYHPGYQDPPYNATLRYEGHRVLGVEVSEVGPWNIEDNYWNSAGHEERPRRLFTDLPQGMPEAQAAYYENYNQGRDQYGRTVLNPGGCDATPDVAADLGLAFLQNAWVEVDYLWESTGGVELVYDTPTARTRGQWFLGATSSDKYGADYLWASTSPGSNSVAYWVVDLASGGSYDLYAWWTQGNNRSAQARLGTRIQGVTHELTVDQRSGGGQWNLLGTYSYPQGRSLIGVSNDAPGGAVVIADAMRLVRR